MDEADVCCMTDAVQLGQVEEALQTEPENAELLSLRTELANLIELTKSLAKQPSSSKSKPTTQDTSSAFRTGDEVMARHQADGKWYPARIASVANTGENAVYSVIYTKTRTTETLNGEELRIRKHDPNAPQPSHSKTVKAQAQRMMTNDERIRERERKKARKEKKLAREAEKNKVHDDKKAAWQTFASKSLKGLNKGYPHTQRSSH
ncbi:hypothetical protein MPSI1_003654 [Malassezia psittaci]|uniref:Tudor domain-containing protein n=1 Tax=Malassezia psittaci TaxID=1821823 RepID=A0AAF0FI86_9BASI|nr:hypothetical protein MPSI1_003654 [Malassezia psittaci]